MAKRESHAKRFLILARDDLRKTCVTVEKCSVMIIRLADRCCLARICTRDENQRHGKYAMRWASNTSCIALDYGRPSKPLM
jgi:hypothetical protein